MTDEHLSADQFTKSVWATMGKPKSGNLSVSRPHDESDPLAPEDDDERLSHYDFTAAGRASRERKQRHASDVAEARRHGATDFEISRIGKQPTKEDWKSAYYDSLEENPDPRLHARMPYPKSLGNRPNPTRAQTRSRPRQQVDPQRAKANSDLKWATRLSRLAKIAKGH